MRIVLYVWCGIMVFYGIRLLFTKRHRTLEHVWLPMTAIGAALELVAYTLEQPWQAIGVWSGLAIVCAGLATHSIAKRRSRHPDL